MNDLTDTMKTLMNKLENINRKHCNDKYSSINRRTQGKLNKYIYKKNDINVDLNNLCRWKKSWCKSNDTMDNK